MHTYIQIKGIATQYLIRLKTGWEFGEPPGYADAEAALLEAIQKTWPSAAINNNPDRLPIDMILMYGPASWSPTEWSLITDQTHWGYSSAMITLDEIIRAIEKGLHIVVPPPQAGVGVAHLALG